MLFWEDVEDEEVRPCWRKEVTGVCVGRGGGALEGCIYLNSASCLTLHLLISRDEEMSYTHINTIFCPQAWSPTTMGRSCLGCFCGVFFGHGYRSNLLNNDYLL